VQRESARTVDLVEVRHSDVQVCPDVLTSSSLRADQVIVVVTRGRRCRDVQHGDEGLATAMKCGMGRRRVRICSRSLLQSNVCVERGYHAAARFCALVVIRSKLVYNVGRRGSSPDQTCTRWMGPKRCGKTLR